MIPISLPLIFNWSESYGGFVLLCLIGPSLLGPVIGNQCHRTTLSLCLQLPRLRTYLCRLRFCYGKYPFLEGCLLLMCPWNRNSQLYSLDIPLVCHFDASGQFCESGPTG